MALESGTRLGPYRISAQIGVGGMGEVYRATDTNLSREVAVKILPEAVANDADRLARFDREAKTLATLSHPRIAGIYGLEKSAGRMALVMELVEGPTLADRIAQGPIPVEEALGLAIQIAEGLEAAHEKGIVHRDLKPANIKVTPDGVVKVLDFGLAKVFERESSGAIDATHSPTLSMAATQAGVILGTAAYMSPEQAKGRPTDRRTDIWAFGCVLFEMLAGRQSFGAPDVTEVLAAVVRAEPDWKSLPKGLPPRLREVLERCLEKEQGRRFRDIGDVRADLERVVTQLRDGTVEGPATSAVHVRSRPPWQLAAAAVIVAVVAGAAAWVLKPAPVSETLPVVRFEHLLEAARQFRNTELPVVAISPDGRHVVYNTNEGLFLRALDSRASRVVPGTENIGGMTNVMYSPDGEWVGYWDGAANEFMKISVNGGIPVRVADADGVLDGASWAPDDRILFATGQRVSIVSADGGEPETLFEVPTEMGFPILPTLLPGGDVLFSLFATPNQIAVWSVESDEVHVLTAGSGATYVPTGHLVYGIDASLYAQPFDLDGLTLRGGPVPILDGVLTDIVSQYAVSGAGSLVYVPGDVQLTRELALGIVERDGTVSALDMPPGAYSSPRASPDGERVAVQTTNATPYQSAIGTVWIYDLSGDTAMRPLAQGGANQHPIWTPDGERVTFGSDRDGTWGIYWQPADGSGVAERLTTAEPGARHWPESWSPDGRTLTYQVLTGDDLDVWTLSLDAPDRPTPLIDGNARQHGSILSPDGRWIAYGSTENLPAEQIFVQPFPPTGVEYQVTQDTAAFPVWAPDGSALSYRRAVSNAAGEQAAALFQVDVVRDGARFSWRNERRLPIGGFQAFGGLRDYDILPDGRFLMVFPLRPAGSDELPPPRIDVVLNWFEELLARVPVD